MYNIASLTDESAQYYLGFPIFVIAKIETSVAKVHYLPTLKRDSTGPLHIQ